MRGRKRQRKKLMKNRMFTPDKSYWCFIQESKKCFTDLLSTMRKKHQEYVDSLNVKQQIVDGVKRYFIEP